MRLGMEEGGRIQRGARWEGHCCQGTYLLIRGANLDVRR